MTMEEGVHRGHQRPEAMDASSWKDKHQQSKCDIQHGNWQFSRWENPKATFHADGWEKPKEGLTPAGDQEETESNGFAVH